MWYINNFPLGDMWEYKQHIHWDPFLCKWWDRAAVMTLTLSRLNECMLHVFVSWWCVVECVCVFPIILFHYAKFPLKKKEPNQNESLILSLCNAFSWRKWRFVQQLNSIVSVMYYFLLQKSFEQCFCCDFAHWLTLFQEPGTWTPSKPFDQGGCEEESLECCWLCGKTEHKKR